MEYYSDFKKEENLSFVRWRELEDTVLSEVSQA
jgi:hypothetical protein